MQWISHDPFYGRVHCTMTSLMAILIPWPGFLLQLLDYLGHNCIYSKLNNEFRHFR